MAVPGSLSTARVAVSAGRPSNARPFGDRNRVVPRLVGADVAPGGSGSWECDLPGGSRHRPHDSVPVLLELLLSPRRVAVDVAVCVSERAGVLVRPVGYAEAFAARDADFETEGDTSRLRTRHGIRTLPVAEKPRGVDGHLGAASGVPECCVRRSPPLLVAVPRDEGRLVRHSAVAEFRIVDPVVVWGRQGSVGVSGDDRVR